MLVQLPFYANLIQNYPDAEITIFSPVNHSQFFIKLGFAHKHKIYKRKKYLSNILLPLRKLKPDIVINLRRKSEILDLCILLSGAKERYGFENWTYKNPVPFNVYKYIALNYLELAYSMPLEKKVGLEVINTIQDKAVIKIDTTKKHICFMPGGGEGEYKRWGVNNFCNLALTLLKSHNDLLFVFILGDQEKSMIETIKEKLPEKNYLIQLNSDVSDIVKLTKSSVVTVANDCGPSHLSQMSGANYIGLWGYKEEDSPFHKIREWHLPRDNAFIITASEDKKDIKTISPETVSLIIEGRFLGKNN